MWGLLSRSGGAPALDGTHAWCLNEPTLGTMGNQSWVGSEGTAVSGQECRDAGTFIYPLWPAFPTMALP